MLNNKILTADLNVLSLIIFSLAFLAFNSVFVPVAHSYDRYIPQSDNSYMIPLSDFEERNKVAKNNLAQASASSKNIYEDAYKYCGRDYYLKIFYETSCCAQILTDGRKSGKHFSSIVFKATKETFAGCVSEVNIYENAYRRSRSLLMPSLNNDRYGPAYSQEEIESTSICTGKTLVKTFSQNPIPRRNLYNKMFRSSFVECKSDRGASFRDQINYPIENKNKLYENDDR